MAGINAGKVVTGGLLAGLVLNILDIANNFLLVGDDFRANATRLGLDPAVAESPAGIATWVVIDFLIGILIVFTYAAIRPRFGHGVKTAIYAGIIPYAAVTLVIFGFTQGGIFPTSLFWTMAVISLIITCVAAVAGAWAYKEG